MADILVRGNSNFAFNLHKFLSINEKNVIFSPFSLSACLAMLLHGTRGSAAIELKKALGLGNLANDDLPAAFLKLLSSIESDADGYRVSYGNSVVIHKEFDVHEQYILTLLTYFKALCSHVDFRNEGPAAVKHINDWVREITHEKIPQLLESLDPDTVMVLLNAVYFKGSWLKEFQEKATFKQYFYNDGIEDNATLIEMMHLKESFLFFENPEYKALELPYKGEEVALLILLPNSRDGLNSLEEQISPSFIRDTKSKMSKSKVEVALPKFKLEYSVDLKKTLMNLGVHEVFQVGADFSGFSDCKNLCLSKVVHKAMLEVNEEGCEAAAATAAVVMCRAMIMLPEFIVDHPFLFMIYNNKNNLILFMGRVSEL